MQTHFTGWDKLECSVDFRFAVEIFQVPPEVVCLLSHAPELHSFLPTYYNGIKEHALGYIFKFPLS